ncbi:hypothetical protein [Clostridium sp. UBA6640]|uniref:hypothetical protein n=1 Tax=Clostridium sp. UBA6640 TaxID=1946370 RepID=UPI0025BE7226|nr:hypothetical protein [Clostridium sp. UBA6640]
MRNIEKIITEFKEINFHDGFMRKMDIIPPKELHNCDMSQYAIRFDLTLWDRNFKEIYNAIIQFIDVANINMNVDFDVFSDNGDYQIQGASVESYKKSDDNIVEDCYPKWNIEYSEDMDTPVKYKIENKHKYALFTIELFGGEIKILAKDIKIVKK